IGVLVFVFYQFVAPPLLFNPAHEHSVREAQPAPFAALEAQYGAALAERQTAARALASSTDAGDEAERVAGVAFRSRDSAVTAVRTVALDLANKTTGQPSKDVNYIIPR